MSNPTKVDIVRGGRHLEGIQFGSAGPISVPAGTVVAIGDDITVDGIPCKVTNAIGDCVDSKVMHINIYTAPIGQ